MSLKIRAHRCFNLGVWRAGRSLGRRSFEDFKRTLDVLLMADLFAHGEGDNGNSGRFLMNEALKGQEGPSCAYIE